MKLLTKTKIFRQVYLAENERTKTTPAPNSGLAQLGFQANFKVGFVLEMFRFY